MFLLVPGEGGAAAAPMEPVPVGFLDGSLGPEDAIPEDMIGALESLGEPVEVTAAGKLSSAERSLEAAPALAAARDGDVEALTSMLKAGWRPNTQDAKGCTALMWASGSGHVAACEVLVEHGANINFCNSSGRTPVQWAARNAQLEACKWLRAHGADVQAVAKDGVNVFHWAVWGRSIPTCMWASEVGVPTDAVNRWGCSAIHWASATGDIELCRYLKHTVGLDFNRGNNQGHDGLKKAAWNGHWGLCEWLLQEAGDQKQVLLQSVDRGGLTAEELARINNQVEVADKLSTQLSGLRRDEAAQHSAFSSTQQLQLPNIEYTLYYRTQNIMTAEEWPAFVQAMGQAPPLLLSLLGRVPPELPRWLVTHQSELEHPVPGFPAGTFQVRAHHYRANRPLQSSLRIAIAAGFAACQDTSVLLPALLLGVGPHHRVLDIAASGAERPLQCLDMMRMEDGSYASGVLFVNALNARVFLSDAAKRLQQVSPSCVATVGNGAKFPCLFQGKAQVLFDRILCEPPCSLDGVLRDKPDQWSRWTIKLALENHNALLKLLLRSLHNLAPGGRLLYTVRSLNPLEAEAVALAALKRYKGVVSVGVVNGVEGIHLAPGLAKWSVPDPARTSNFRYLDRWEDVPTHLRAPQGVLRTSMFVDNDDADAVVVAAQAVRVYPHNTDSNALFAVVLEKHAHTPSLAEDWVDRTVSKGGWPTWSRQYSKLPVTHELWRSISEFYGLEQAGSDWYLSYETHRHSLQVEDTKSIRLHTESAHRLLLDSQPPLQPNGIHITGAGLSMFEPFREKFLREAQCRWFPSVEACSLLGSLTCCRRVLRMRLDRFRDWLQQKRAPIADMQEELRRAGIDPLAVGGLVVGLLDDEPRASASPVRGESKEERSGIHASSIWKEVVWVPGVNTHTELLVYANKATVEGILQMIAIE